MNETELESAEEIQKGALERLLATETGVYVVIFFGILGILTILAIFGQEHLVLVFGVGSLLAFLVIMLLSISDQIYTLFCEKKRGTALGLAILGIFIVLIWRFVPADSSRQTLLSLIVAAIFLLWTLVQAYFMSMPISKTTAQIASKFEEPKSVTYSYLVLAASVVLPGVFYPYLAWKMLPVLGVESRGLLDYLWVVGMIGLVVILWILVLRFLRPNLDKQDAIIFGGIFFLVYMLFIFYRSLFFLTNLHDILGGTSNPSLTGNIIDVLFMIMTILLAVYSFSKRAFGTNLPLLNENNSIFIAFAFGAGYASAQLYFVVKATISTISMISHLLIFVCSIFVLLFIPYSYVIAKGYIVPTPFREAFSLRKMEIASGEGVIEEVPVEEAPVEEVIEETPVEEVIEAEEVEEPGAEEPGEEE